MSECGVHYEGFPRGHSDTGLMLLNDDQEERTTESRIITGAE